MVASRATAEAVAAAGTPLYGVTGGLGHNRDMAPASPVDETAVLRAHATGVGDDLPPADARALIAAAVSALATGGSAAHPRLVEALAGLLSTSTPPSIPDTGSLGAGDLTSMAALGLAVVAAGYVLQPQDALALLSCNAQALGTASLAWSEGNVLVAALDAAAALSWHAIDGGAAPYSAAVGDASGDPGIADAAARMRALGVTDMPGVSLQDPLSFRVIPQVHGALLLSLGDVHAAAATCLSGRLQNPLFADGAAMASGNFQVLRLALAVEALRVAVAHAAALAERRCARLCAFSFGIGGVPDGDPGALASSGMLAYTAAALLARIRHAATPASALAPPVDGSTEDHATMAPLTIAITRTAVRDAATIAAIETILATDAIGGGAGHPPHGDLAALSRRTSALVAAHDVRTAVQRVRDSAGVG